MLLFLAVLLHANLQYTIRGHAQTGREVAFSPDSQIVATSSPDGTVKLWRTADGKAIRRLSHPGGVTSVIFSPDGRMLADGGYDHDVRIWRVADGALLRTLHGHGATVWTVDWSPDGRQIATGGDDNTVRLWRAADGAPLRILKGHARNVWKVRFSPDGHLLATGSFDKTIKLWRTDSGQLVRTFTGSKEAVVGLDYSPDGQFIASGGDDTMVRIWRVRDGRQVRAMNGNDHIYNVAYTPDGQFLVTGGREYGNIHTLWKQIAGTHESGSHGATAQLWRVRDGALVQELRAHADDIWAVAISADGKWLATSSEDKTVKVWRLTEKPAVILSWRSPGGAERRRTRIFSAERVLRCATRLRRSHIATENFARRSGSKASVREFRARTIVDSAAMTDTVRGESSMNDTSPRTSPGPTVATVVGWPSRPATMSRCPPSTANSVESLSPARIRYCPFGTCRSSPSALRGRVRRR
ncbi:MAG TPA: WD40 repeat domain-containing protein [Thermoanaerobaculia bacterium]|jgi:WD40 repeat protein|nr:WD40 repeat domain-containing protein [Thermoanaerobaculia bacterium]